MRKKKAEVDLMPSAKPQTPRREAEPDGKGLWFLVLRHLEHNHVSYFPLNHHLVAEHRLPDKVPSMGGVRKGDGSVGDNEIPTDGSGKINLAGESPRTIFALVQNGTLRPVVMSKRLTKILEEGRRMNATAVTDLVPPMRKIVTPMQQYEQATGVPYTAEGQRNLATAQQRMGAGR